MARALSIGRAVRVAVGGEVRGEGFRASVVERAEDLGATGWVRHGPDGGLLAHVEGSDAAVEGVVGLLEEGPAGTRIDSIEVEEVGPEGHEQFAVRGVSAGEFSVTEVDGTFILRLPVDGHRYAWTLRKEPSMDPADKRMAIAVEEKPEPEASGGAAWDTGAYEQGGRVRWPEALERGHAVFVLHGDRLEGGFALQRTGGEGSPRWLLIKRRDEFARRG